MKKTLLSIWKVVKNKYVAVSLAFLLFFFFVGENNYLVANRLQREVSQLSRECEALRAEIEKDSIEANSLFSDPQALEAYGREHYYMKRPNEDIFIIN